MLITMKISDVTEGKTGDGDLRIFVYALSWCLPLDKMAEARQGRCVDRSS